MKPTIRFRNGWWVVNFHSVEALRVRVHYERCGSWQHACAYLEKRYSDGVIRRREETA